MIPDTVRSCPRIEAEKFRDLEEGEQHRYIHDRLHLDFYSECSGEVRNDGRRFIGLVRRSAAENNEIYYLYPVDCLNETETFERRILFEDIDRIRIPGKGITAAQKACEEIDQNDMGMKMVSAKYQIAPRDRFLPIWVSDIRVLDCSPAEMIERIKGILAKVRSLTGTISQMEQQQKELEKKLETVRGIAETESDKLRRLNEECERIKQAWQEEADRKRRMEEASKALEVKAHAFADRLQEYGLEVDRAALGLSLPAEQPQEQDRNESIPDLSLLAKQVRDAISQEQKLFYEEHIIREFLGAMFTGQLIILSGPPGTGKSSLPPAIAKCIGAECRMVSVQPSWTDNQDLLGFYDPTRERFAATPFLNILVEARNDPGVIYLVCLDEMNLVRVEYYFSEILSAMEAEKMELRLYSPYTHDLRRKTLRRQLGTLLGQEPSQDTVEKLYAIQDALALLDRYEALFPLPDNVQFIGTLNMDETTKGLSPKVLDRSFIIDIGRRAEPVGIASPDPARNHTPPAGQTPLHSFSPLAFREGICCGLDDDGVDKLERDLDSRMAELKKWLEAKQLQEVSVSLSARGRAHIDKLFRRGLELDDVFLGKILCAMRYTEPELDDLIQEQAGQTFHGTTGTN